MQEMFRHLSPSLPIGSDTDCPVILSLPETVLEQDRPDGERRCSIELEKRRAGARISTGSHVEGIKEEGDVLAEAAAAVAEVEQSSAVADGGAAVSPTSAPRSYASLVPRPHHIHFVHVCCRIHELTSCGSSSTAKRERAAARHPAERIFLPFGGISPV